eukprot:11410707-Karenia_brevis.AAC.1
MDASSEEDGLDDDDPWPTTQTSHLNSKRGLGGDNVGLRVGGDQRHNGREDMSPQDLVQLEMLRALRRLREKRSESSGSSSSEGEEHKRSVLSGIHVLRRNLKKRPQKVIRNYEERVKRDLGVRSDNQVWCYTDWAKTLHGTFGKLK